MPVFWMSSCATVVVVVVALSTRCVDFFFQAEDGIRDLGRSRGLGDVYKRQPDALDELTIRGFRADESKPGSGLGLAIVRDIVDSYEGSLQFAHSAALGGLRVEVRLPATGQTQFG